MVAVVDLLFTYGTGLTAVLQDKSVHLSSESNLSE